MGKTYHGLGSKVLSSSCSFSHPKLNFERCKPPHRQQKCVIFPTAKNIADCQRFSNHKLPFRSTLSETFSTEAKEVTKLKFFLSFSSYNLEGKLTNFDKDMFREESLFVYNCKTMFSFCLLFYFKKNVKKLSEGNFGVNTSWAAMKEHEKSKRTSEHQ